MKGKTRVWIASMTGGDVSETEIPRLLLHQEFVPNVIFLSLEAFARLLRFHFGLLLQMSDTKILRRIYIDEIHTILSETFRQDYEQFRRVGRLNCPVTTLSASLPKELMGTVHSYLNIASTELNVISGNDLLGEFPSVFFVDVNICENTLKLTLQRISTLLQLHGDREAIHIFAPTKNHAQKIHDDIRKKFPVVAVGLVTSELKDHGDIASKWKSSSLSVLVSTTSALVGNENPKCRHVIICGTIYNILNVVQAFGRLRPTQRKAGGSIFFYVDKITPQQAQLMVGKMTPEFEHLRNRKLIPNNIATFRKYLSPLGIHDWVHQDGCLLRNLSALLGKTISDCGICCVCRGTKRRATVCPLASCERRSESDASHGHPPPA